MIWLLNDILRFVDRDERKQLLDAITLIELQAKLDTIDQILSLVEVCSAKKCDVRKVIEILDHLRSQYREIKDFFVQEADPIYNVVYEEVKNFVEEQEKEKKKDSQLTVEERSSTSLGEVK